MILAKKVLTAEARKARVAREDHRPSLAFALKSLIIRPRKNRVGNKTERQSKKFIKSS